MRWRYVKASSVPPVFVDIHYFLNVAYHNAGLMLNLPVWLFLNILTLPLSNSHLYEIHMCTCNNCNGDNSSHAWLSIADHKCWMTWTQCSLVFLICALLRVLHQYNINYVVHFFVLDEIYCCNTRLKFNIVVISDVITPQVLPHWDW